MKVNGIFLFPETREEAIIWQHFVDAYTLGPNITAVAHTRIEETWTAYIGCREFTPNYEEMEERAKYILEHGTKLEESVARAMFPNFAALLYA